MGKNKERLKNESNDDFVFGENEEKKDNKEQSALFEGEDFFTEAMVVEKESIEVNSEPEGENEKKSDKGDTVIFSLSKENNAESEISHEELTAADIEESAKEYYNATHADNIQDKVRRLQELANDGFADDEVPESELFSYEDNEDTQSSKNDSKRKKKRRGYVSNDDMALLAEKEEVSNTEKALDDSNADAASEVEDEESSLFKLIGGEDTNSEEYLKKYEDLYASEDVEIEYTSREQEGSVLAALRKSAMSRFASVFITLIATVICAYFEIAAVTALPSPSLLKAGRFGVTYSMLMLQIMFVCIIFNLDGVKRAFKGLNPYNASFEAFSAVTIVACTLHSVSSVLLAGKDMSLRSYCSIGCLSLFMLSLNSFFKAQTTLRAFCVAASKKPKLSCKTLDRNSDEAEAFEQYLDTDSEIVTVLKSDFVEGFFKKIKRIPNAAGCSFKRICVFASISAVIGIIAGIIKGNAYAGISAFATAILTSLPVNSLLVTAFPFFKMSAKASDTQTAFLGEAVCDVYDDMNVISFDDTEVFPPKGVKVSSIKMYENHRIDKVILYMAKIFEKVRGPLSYVFENSVHDADENMGEAQIIGFYKGGIKAEIDGKTVLVGRDDFMLINELVPIEDNIDEGFKDSLGSIMYMAVDGTLAAKLYIKYSINNEFENILRSFYDAGICVAVKTLDPCVTTELVEAFLEGENYPFAVINKGGDGIPESSVEEKTNSAVISLSGIHSFLKGFIMADKLRNIYRINSAFGLASAVVGILFGALSITGFAGEVGTAFMLVYQLIWCLPSLLISSFSK